jgi:putative component of toxin-antitoxin plasmid stabilization module
VFEMREHFGCGWRMYYVQRGDVTGDYIWTQGVDKIA